MPVLDAPPPAVGAAFLPNALVYPWNMAGLPAVALSRPGKPGSAIQLIGPRGGEELLLATAALVEASINY
jgi:Asp-tRNA(Asn)/Glu-tRNA(Gln) amidotransferase A subunit family amidase